MRGNKRVLMCPRSAHGTSPRACGENIHPDLSYFREQGISPRMRGKQLLKPCQWASTGNIPAYAGKTAFETLPMGFDREHPRVCGENPATPPRDGLTVGTSPRMRGKPLQCGVGDVSSGNIPAYAGKTTPANAHPGTPAEHPRARGENAYG